MKLFLSAAASLALFFTACNSSAPAALQQYLINSDSIAINFYLPGTQNVEKVEIIRDSVKIRNFIRLMQEAKVREAGCEPTGDLHFFDQNQVILSAGFAATDSCNSISYQLDGKAWITDLNSEAQQIIALNRNK